MRKTLDPFDRGYEYIVLSLALTVTLVANFVVFPLRVNVSILVLLSMMSCMNAQLRGT